MNRRTYLKYALALSGALSVPASIMSLVGRHGVSTAANLAGFDGRIMGTGYSVRFGALQTEYKAQVKNTVRTANAGATNLLNGQQLDGLAHLVHATLQDVDHRMSTWRETSELSLFNNSIDQDWHKVSSKTLGIIDNAMRISDLSAGAFDVSVGPLVDLWGFGAVMSNSAAAHQFEKPSNKAIAKCMQIVGYNAIEINHDQSAIRKQIPAAKLDLSGIAKGFAVDQVAKLLDAQGYENYLVEVGGELRSSGKRSKNQDWRVAIERPYTARRDVFRVLNLRNSAVATSGDYRNFYLDGGQRYSHSIDPRHGSPVNHELVSVSVIANTTMLADAYTTALIIMGPDEAHAFATQHRIAAHFVHKSASGKLDEQFSPLFSEYIS